MSFWGKVKSALGPGEREPGVVTTADFDQTWLAGEIANELAKVFAEQRKKEKLAPFIGSVAINIDDTGKTMRLPLENCVVDGDSPLLRSVGNLLKNMKDPVYVDIAEVVDERGTPRIKGGRGTVLRSHVEVTPAPILPPDDRAVFFPPEHETGEDAPLKRLGDYRTPTIGEQVADPVKGAIFRSGAGFDS